MKDQTTHYFPAEPNQPRKRFPLASRLGANCWGGLSIDETRGLVFVSAGSATFDFCGGGRVGGANLSANCVIARKADTGERVWHFQMVHLDLWDHGSRRTAPRSRP